MAWHICYFVRGWPTYALQPCRHQFRDVWDQFHLAHQPDVQNPTGDVAKLFQWQNTQSAVSSVATKLCCAYMYFVTKHVFTVK